MYFLYVLMSCPKAKAPAEDIKKGASPCGLAPSLKLLTY